MKKIIVCFLAVFISIQPAAAEGKPEIVATIGMIADVTENIARDKASVAALIGSGIDPHLYKPTRTDIAKLSSADMVFYNGLLLEGKMTDALIRVAASGRKVFPVTELIDPGLLLEPPGFQGHYDPHVWMNPKFWIKTAELIETKLSEAYPENKTFFSANAKEYIKKLEELDLYSEKCAGSIPKDKRLLITAHDAFNYFGKRYGIEVLGIQGISTESEAGVKDIENIVNTIVTRKISAVFVESTVSERNIQALIEGAEAKGHEVKIGGELFSDAMGKAGTYEGTYIGMIDHNVTKITKALGGTAPEKGMKGMLHE